MIHEIFNMPYSKPSIVYLCISVNDAVCTKEKSSLPLAKVALSKWEVIDDAEVIAHGNVETVSSL